MPPPCFWRPTWTSYRAGMNSAWVENLQVPCSHGSSVEGFPKDGGWQGHRWVTALPSGRDPVYWDVDRSRGGQELGSDFWMSWWASTCLTAGCSLDFLETDLTSYTTQTPHTSPVSTRDSDLQYTPSSTGWSQIALYLNSAISWHQITFFSCNILFCTHGVALCWTVLNLLITSPCLSFWALLLHSGFLEVVRFL